MHTYTRTFVQTRIRKSMDLHTVTHPKPEDLLPIHKRFSDFKSCCRSIALVGFLTSCTITYIIYYYYDKATMTLPNPSGHDGGCGVRHHRGVVVTRCIAPSTTIRTIYTIYIYIHVYSFQEISTHTMTGPTPLKGKYLQTTSTTTTTTPSERVFLYFFFFFFFYIYFLFFWLLPNERSTVARICMCT